MINKNLFFSIIYPTRNRPLFIEKSIKFLEKQNYDNFEVIICDNYDDESLSCKKYCNEVNLDKIYYIKPDKNLSMVQNWNYSLKYANGDYIFYFTDKMFLLPNALRMANEILSHERYDILNWLDNTFHPHKFPEYFESGFYDDYSSKKSIKTSYIPKEELAKKAFSKTSRSEQNKADYARGKICFGCYSKDLIDQIVKKTGNLFHDISPDYTSMILALSYARKGCELKNPGIVHINTDLSNGGNAQVNESSSINFLKTLNSYPELLDNLMIPNLYSSVHNVVTHDYIFLSKKFDLCIKTEQKNWLIYIIEDYFSVKFWSSEIVKFKHGKILYKYFKSLNFSIKLYILTKLVIRFIRKSFKILLLNLKVNKLKNKILHNKFVPSTSTLIKINRIEDIIT